MNSSSLEAPPSSGGVRTGAGAANRGYFPALDGIRALAFLMVFAQHYLNVPWGWTGVDVFFVLSGFLITGILFDTRYAPHRVSNFYLRRTLRIFPLYYGVMLFLLIVYPVFRWQWGWSWLWWPAYLGNFCHGLHPAAGLSPRVLLANFYALSRSVPRFGFRLGHFWSLCVEEQFYLIWPWVVFLVRDRRKLLYICFTCVTICPLMRLVANHMILHAGLDGEVLYRWTPFRVDALLLGGLVALVRRGPAQRQLLVAARVGFGVLLSALVLWLALNPSARHKPAGYVYPSWQLTWGLVFADVFSACLIVMALEPDSAAFRVFNLRPLRWLGRISYGAYVFHDIPHDQYGFLIAFFHIPHARVTLALLALASTLLLSWASFRWFESPFIRLKERWTQRTEPDRQSAPVSEPVPL